MIERIALHDKFVKEFKKYIIDNNLQIGDKLPSQAQFVDMYKLSRSSVREATRTLHALNIIDILNGKGMYVKSNTFVTDDTDTKTKTKERLLWILEVRRSLEKLAVELSVNHADQNDLQVMEQNLIKMEELASQGLPHPVYDKAFHNAIYNSSKNPILINTVMNLNAEFSEMWKNPLNAGDALTEGTDYHRVLFEAIKNRDEKSAKQAFQVLIDQVEIIVNNI